MEYVAGETLASVIHRRAPASIVEKLIILEEVCDALRCAHEAGIIHRDIKPANIMLEDATGAVKILDFGIAHAGETGLTNAGEMVGTLNYMAPEQISGAMVDQRTDIYAVGVLAYELLSYQRAFAGTIQEGILIRLLQGAPQPSNRSCRASTRSCRTLSSGRWPSSRRIATRTWNSCGRSSKPCGHG